MNRKQKIFLSCCLLLIAPIIGFIGYLLLSTLLLPFLENSLSEFTTRAIIICLTLVLVFFFLRLFLHDMAEINILVSKGEFSERYKSNRRKWLLSFSLLSFAMAPFGFAGMLEGRGGEALSPIWGGGLCLVIGIILLLFYIDS